MIFNTLALSYNLQGKVKKSIDRLKRAHDCALSISDFETKIVHASEEDRIPIVETCLNLAKGHAYLNNLNKAIEYAEECIQIGSKIDEKLA